MAVDIKLDSESGELTIRVSGGFDFSVHQAFRKASELDEATVKSIVIDLRTTDYIDSSALGMLLIMREKVNNDKRAIKIVNVRPEVKKILQIANFDKIFTLA